ncbi:Dienelactone hydrolase [Geosmithia morbida]|uniref:Dienelactone hydrolase n=1 Tax=Geosmithia morbida TaxID=1094350 RepID=A0A9P4YR91_9HYPO|nr:Dienelactone hydrolase [Geosmithia morbida]KAF4121107.1 Dienelactone hydrolase [Geosmithia morbida]
MSDASLDRDAVVAIAGGGDGPGTSPRADDAAPAQHHEAEITTALPPGAHCVTDRPTPVGQASTGEAPTPFFQVYVSKPADYPHTRSRLLLLLTGGTGIKSVNNQIQADRYASEGFLVLMPDMFAGDDAPGATAITDDSTSILEQIKLKAAEMAKSFVIDMWLARVTPDRVMPILRRVIEAAHDQYGDAVRNGDGIYAVGYCVGGRFVILLARETAPTAAAAAASAAAAAGDGGDQESAKPKTEGPYIRAGAIAHAASVAPEDFTDVKVPLSFACVEDDPLFPDAVRIHGEDLMAEYDLEHEVHVYPGVPHGFAVVGEYTDSAIRSAQATAYEQMLRWVQTH